MKWEVQLNGDPHDLKELCKSLLLDFGHSGIDPLQTRQERAGVVLKLGEVC